MSYKAKNTSDLSQGVATHNQDDSEELDEENKSVSLDENEVPDDFVYHEDYEDPEEEDGDFEDIVSDDEELALDGEELVSDNDEEEDLVESVTQEKKQKHNFIQSLSQFSAVLSERARRNDRSLLAMVLEGKTSSEREHILQVAYHAGIEGDDPLFAVLLATGQLELLLSKKPEELNGVFDSWQVRWSEELQYADAMFENTPMLCSSSKVVNCVILSIELKKP